MTVHPFIIIAHAVDTITEAALGPRTAPDLAPLWCVVIRTVMWLVVVHPTPPVSVCSKGADRVGQGLW